MNTTPYHSADNGFACAAAGKGIPEALQEHLNIIVRNEELELEKSHSQIREDINGLVSDQERLEAEKLDQQNRLNTLNDTLAKKDIKLSQLKAELEVPMAADLPVENPQVDALRDQMDALKPRMDATAETLETKQVERVGLQTDLESPTTAELDAAIDGTDTIPPKQRRSVAEWIFAVFGTFVVLGLIGYLIIFYASVGDRTFTQGTGTNVEKQHIIIPGAFFEAWKAEAWFQKNWFVITFPFIFLTLACLIYLCEEHKNTRLRWGLLGATALIDLIIAYKISEQMHYFTHGDDTDYKLSENWVEIGSVFLLGFGVSLLLGYGLYWIMKLWRGEKPNQGASEHLALLKRAEHNDLLIRFNPLTTEIEHLETQLQVFKQEYQGLETQLQETLNRQNEARIENHKHPISVEIAEVETEKETLQSRIDECNEQVESLQREINQCQAEIQNLLKRESERVIDIKKLESQANQFISGWCRYVAQSKTDLPADTANQIKEIQNLATETLEAYKTSLQTV